MSEPKIELSNYQDLINDKPIHIATVNRLGNPNLAVASDVRLIRERERERSSNHLG